MLAKARVLPKLLQTNFFESLASFDMMSKIAAKQIFTVCNCIFCSAVSEQMPGTLGTDKEA